jgi:hypothetical protein
MLSAPKPKERQSSAARPHQTRTTDGYDARSTVVRGSRSRWRCHTHAYVGHLCGFRCKLVGESHVHSEFVPEPSSGVLGCDHFCLATFFLAATFCWTKQKTSKKNFFDPTQNKNKKRRSSELRKKNPRIGETENTSQVWIDGFSALDMRRGARSCHVQVVGCAT